MDTRRSILDFIHHFTVAWQIQRFVALERLLLADAVFEMPSQTYEGRDACLEVCCEPEFTREEEVLSVDWVEGAATVVLDWRRTGGSRGRDVHELRHDGVRWKLAHFRRQPILPDSPANGEPNGDSQTDCGQGVID
jgi:hypothetical protein